MMNVLSADFPKNVPWMVYASLNLLVCDLTSDPKAHTVIIPFL